MTTMIPSPRLRILECTLRDGSYAINFGFTAADTTVIAQALDTLGFPLIEVGHGIGLGASEANMGEAAETDEGYMRAAAEGVRKNKWGMFCIPGIARLDHIDMAADYGMGFIRIGTNVEDAEKAKPFIERAKSKGLFVCTNFMKSYTVAPSYFADRARLAEEFGADVVYIVDSAGGMLPDEIDVYVDAVRRVSDVALGFHGHHNLGLGVATALRATELGIEIVDTSLQGLGRSAGNTPTEQYIAVLNRIGINLGIDLLDALDVGDRYIKPLIAQRGLNSLDVVCGLAQFHSSYMGTIRQYASKYRIDPRRLIIAVCERDRANAPAAMVEEEAVRLAGSLTDSLTARFNVQNYFGAEQG